MEAAESLNNSDPGNRKAKAFHKLFNGFKPNGLTRVTTIAESVSKNARASVLFESPYDAGLGFTALSVVTVAAAILHKQDEGEKFHGFQTAVVAVGPELLTDYYKKVGVKIESSVKNVSKL